MTLLTATLIVGVITIVGLLVIRLVGAVSAAGAGSCPRRSCCPPAKPRAPSRSGRGWVAVVTVDAAGTERIRVLDADTGAERAGVLIAPAP